MSLDLPTREAVLLVDVAGSAPGVRSATVENGWAKLYKAGAYYIDLALTPRAETADLIGELLAAPGDETIPQGSVTLSDTRRDRITHAQLDASGGFAVALHRGRYQLDIQLDKERLVISELEVG